MRKHYWWLGAGTIGAGVFLGALGQYGWGQPGDLPGTRPPSTPPMAQKDQSKTVTLVGAVTEPPTSLPPPEFKLPPPPVTGEKELPRSNPPITVLPEPSPVAPPALKTPPPTSTGPEIIVSPSRTRTDVNDYVPPRLPQTTVSQPVVPQPTAPQNAFPQDVLPTAAASSQAPLSLVFNETLSVSKQEPAVSVEWIGPVSAQLNRPMSCQILVRNTGPAPVHQVTVRHRLSPGVTCKRSEPAASTDREELVWSLGVMQPGQQRRLEVQLVASQRGAMNCQATVAFSTSAGQQVQVREPLLLLKMRAPEKALVGENVNLLFAVANPGDGVAELVKVKALLPEGLECSRGRIVEMDIGNLAPKETRTLQIACVAKAAGAHKAMIAANAEGNLAASDYSITDILEAKLDLVMHGPKLRYLDRHAVYLLKVTNPGSAAAQNVTLQEVVPAGFKFHTATGGGRWDEAAKTVSWQLGDLLPGQTREVSIDLLATAAGDHRLQAQVTSSRGVRTDAAAVTRVEGSSSLVIELADVDDPVEVGGETAYEIRVTNAGTKMETNLELSCTLPDGVEFKGAKSIAGVRHRIEGREIIFDPLPRLAPRADVIYRVHVRGLQAGDFRLRARVRADGMPEPVLREESTRFYNDNILPR